MPELAGVRSQERADLDDNTATCIHVLAMSASLLLQRMSQQNILPDLIPIFIVIECTLSYHEARCVERLTGLRDVNCACLTWLSSEAPCLLGSASMLMKDAARAPVLSSIPAKRSSAQLRFLPEHCAHMMQEHRTAK